MVWKHFLHTFGHLKGALVSPCEMQPQHLVVADRNGILCGLLLLEPLCIKIQCCALIDILVHALFVMSG